MKKLLMLFLVGFSAHFAFAGDNIQKQNRSNEKSSRTEATMVRTVPLKPCTVTVTQYGTATGVNCNGVMYSTTISSACTRYSSASCDAAFVAAESCSSSALPGAIAAYNASQQNCN